MLPSPHRHWEEFAPRMATGGLFFDFDGVLAPITPDPPAARPVTGVVAALAALSRQVRTVAVVSGRPLGFLLPIFAELPSVDLHGAYGMEHRLAGATAVVHPAAEQWIPVLRAVVALARRELPTDLTIEDKRLTVALHYRRHPHLAAMIGDWAVAAGERFGLRVHTARMAVEFFPPVERDKGTVLRDETEKLDGAWFFGDDLADLTAFRALRSRSSADPGFRDVCVAIFNPETGTAVSQSADFTLASPESLRDFLVEVTQTPS
ncbi:trehalose 6-phosphate phosphatase [Micromonospora luteifusca]|uniref:Trehalose 6-phosphate phosphatase n=1 Tax=Micromonospora luteifusca TaxID=709860 RepID=A0ABS2M2F4_9ACTN|nr:trehalose-phosphatase [Micromonospora luteifusca]MBM7494319.1 trehalose 6-phosphate phosphatase [Micromonospora luteifusca]